MPARIKKLTIQVWTAAITFAVGVALTMLWVLPPVAEKKAPVAVVSSDRPQQQPILVPDGWRELEFDKRVFISLPADMQSEEPFGDSRRYREVYGNERIYLTIVGHLLFKPEEVLRTKRVYPCKPPEVDDKNSYSQSPLQIDGRQAKLWITHTVDRGIGASLCFPNADDSIFELELLALCEDEQALATVRQIFSSIRFKD